MEGILSPLTLEIQWARTDRQVRRRVRRRRRHHHHLWCEYAVPSVPFVTLALVDADLDNNLSFHSLQPQAGVREVGHRKSGDPAALCHGRDGRCDCMIMIPSFSAELRVPFLCLYFYHHRMVLSLESGCSLHAALLQVAKHTRLDWCCWRNL